MHIVSGGWDGKVRRWRMEDRQEVGIPMDTGSPIFNIAVSRDGRWVVSGTRDGAVTVWNAESHEKVAQYQGHTTDVRAVDISPDGTRIVTGSYDDTVCVWSRSTGQQLLGPLQHDNLVVTAKFSPNGRLIATATWNRDSSHDGHLLVDSLIRVNSYFNNSFDWASDSKRLFALSRDGKIHCLDVLSGTTLSKWPIHSSINATCITLAGNNRFIAASAGRSISFWDTTTQEQVGLIIEHSHDIWTMAISENYEFVTSGGRTISISDLRDILPASYFDEVSALDGFTLSTQRST